MWAREVGGRQRVDDSAVFGMKRAHDGEPTSASGPGGLCGDGILAWPTPRPLPGDRGAVDEELPAPNAPGFGAVERTVEAGRDHGT